VMDKTAASASRILNFFSTGGIVFTTTAVLAGGGGFFCFGLAIRVLCGKR
jgi:hypothetical protein